MGDLTDMKLGKTKRVKLVEKKNHNACHGIFLSEKSALEFLRVTVPVYVRSGYYSDKTLTPESFEVITS